MPPLNFVLGLPQLLISNIKYIILINNKHLKGITIEGNVSTRAFSKSEFELILKGIMQGFSKCLLKLCSRIQERGIVKCIFLSPVLDIMNLISAHVSPQIILITLKFENH